MPRQPSARSLSSPAASASPAPPVAPAAPDTLDRPLGVHLQTGTGLLKAAERAGAIGATAIQVFADNPTAWRRRTEMPADLEAFRERVGALSLGPVAVHAMYLVNLCGPDPTFWVRSVESLVAEMRTAARYGASFLNVHIGSHVGTGVDEGLARLGAGVTAVLQRTGDDPDLPLFVLENAAGTRNSVGSSIEELERALDAVAHAGGDTSRVGFCLDTAHLWGAGYDLSDADALDRMLAEFDRRLGLDRLVMLHVNDSRASLGSGLDRHDHIGSGGIGEVGLGNVLRHPALAHVPAFLETPRMDEGYDEHNLLRARALGTGIPLPPLPPDAAERPPRRSRGPRPKGRDADQGHADASRGEAATGT